MFCFRVHFMTLFTVALAQRYESFNTRVSSCPPLIRIAKKISYISSCQKFSSMVNRRGRLLLLLLERDVSLNPGPLTLGVLNARSVRNKGPLLADMVASNDLDFLCLTETNIRPFDADSFMRFFLTGLVPQVLVVVVDFSLDPPIDPIKLNLPCTSHLEIWWCQSVFMAVHCCLPASTTLQDHVPHL